MQFTSLMSELQNVMMELEKTEGDHGKGEGVQVRGFGCRNN